ncbi:MAG: MazG nucleotide pyrophosphohydrolase domain-containing protein [Clostridia bacterium]
MLKKQKELYELLNEKNSLNEIQNYIKEIITIRGFSEQRVQDKMLLLLEETGELAKAIRKTLPEASIDYEKIENYTDIEEEIADVFIVLVSICNRLNINLYDAMKKKEEKNIERQWKVNEGEKNEQKLCG